MAQVEQFAREKGMEEQLPYLKKGALLAQNPKDFENIPELDEEDRAIIRREVTRMSSLSHCLFPGPDDFSRSMVPAKRHVQNGHHMFYCRCRPVCSHLTAPSDRIYSLTYSF